MSESGLDSLDHASRSDVGRVRQANEDHCGDFRHASGARLFVVADGMGGHRGGATASQTAVEIIGDIFQGLARVDQDGLKGAIEEANRRIFQMAAEIPDLRGMGTTAVCLLLPGGSTGWVAHVGDSRAYRMRGDQLLALTADHSVVAAMARQGLITEEEAELHPRRNEILRCVGVEPEVQVEINTVDLRAGDRLLLCSDGLTGLVGNGQIAEILLERSPDEAAAELIETANMLGGTDNITVQVADYSASAAAAAATRVNATANERATGAPAEHKLSSSQIQWAGIIGIALLGLLWLLFC